MNVAAVLILLSALVTKIIERVRAHWPRLDGDLVNLAAIALGVALAVAIDLRGAGELAATAGLELGTIPVWLDYGLTGIGIGLGAGIVADIASNRVKVTELTGPTIGRHEVPPEEDLGH